MNTLNELFVDPTNLKFRYSGTSEHYEWNDGVKAETQTADPDTGKPLWKVRVTIIDPVNQATTAATVTVPSVTPPTADFDTEIGFEQLVVKFWVMNGNMGQSFKAGNIRSSTTTATSTTATSTAGSSTAGSKSKAKASA